MAGPTADRMAVAAIMATADKIFRLKIEFFCHKHSFSRLPGITGRGTF